MAVVFMINPFLDDANMSNLIDWWVTFLACCLVYQYDYAGGFLSRNWEPKSHIAPNV